MDVIMMEQGEDSLLTRRVGGVGGIWDTWGIARGARRRDGRRRRASLSSSAHHGEVCDKNQSSGFFKIDKKFRKILIRTKGQEWCYERLVINRRDREGGKGDED